MCAARRTRHNARAQQGNARDCYYTRDDVALECITRALSHLSLPPTTHGTVIEPSAGSGAFCRALGTSLPSWTRLCIELDPDPGPSSSLSSSASSSSSSSSSCPSSSSSLHCCTRRYQPMDFMQWVPGADMQRPVMVMGNPPFGHRASLAVRFFNHAVTECGADVVGMILPRTFALSSLHARLAPGMRLVACHNLPQGSFLHQGRPVGANVCWQLWVRDPPSPFLPPLSSPRSLSFPLPTLPLSSSLSSSSSARLIEFVPPRRENPAEMCDVAVYRVGKKAGRVVPDLPALCRAHRDEPNRVFSNFLYIRFVDPRAREWFFSQTAPAFDWTGADQVRLRQDAGQAALSRASAEAWFARHYPSE